MKTPELKPCPFCGGEADYKDDGQYGYAYCTCCLARTDERYSWRDPEWKREVASEWNTRVYPKEVQEAIKKQNPKKPDGGINKYGFVIGCCKSCDAVIDGDCQYCPHCGQRLDWSDYES